MDASKGKERNSNLELLRIVAMILIVAHHFVVNSGVTGNYTFDNVTGNMLFLQLWGMWGKTAINVFILISGYFMCVSKFTVKRFAKVYLEAKFYTIVIFMILLAAGYEKLGVGSLLNLVFGYIRTPNGGFTASFFMFYLFVPFYNMLIERMSRREHRILLVLFIIYFTIAPTFLFSGSVFHEPLWYAVLYFTAAYIRLYPEKWTKDNKICGSILLLSVLLACASVLVVDFVGAEFGFTSAYHMVSDSNKLLAFVIGLFSFLFFNNLKIKNSKVINRIAATTFGVLCIHASSDAMRTFLWKDLLNVAGHYGMPLGGLVLYSIASVAGVFIVCSIIDMIRICLIEKPVLNWLGKYKWFHRELY